MRCRRWGTIRRGTSSQQLCVDRVKEVLQHTRLHQHAGDGDAGVLVHRLRAQLGQVGGECGSCRRVSRKATARCGFLLCTEPMLRLTTGTGCCFGHIAQIDVGVPSMAYQYHMPTVPGAL